MFGCLRKQLISGTLCVAASACGNGGVSALPDRATLDQLQSAIVSSTGYPAGSIEVLASPVHVRVSINDRELARADHAVRERAANAVVAKVEEVGVIVCNTAVALVVTGTV